MIVVVVVVVVVLSSCYYFWNYYFVVVVVAYAYNNYNDNDVHIPCRFVLDIIVLVTLDVSDVHHQFLVVYDVVSYVQ